MMNPVLFTGNVKEHETKLVVQALEKRERIPKFDDIEATLCARRIENGSPWGDKIIINVEIKSAKDIKVGLAIHVKHFDDRRNAMLAPVNEEFFSSSTCLLAFANVTSDIKLLEFDTFYFDVNNPGDNYGAEMDIRMKVLWREHQPIYPTVIDKKVVVCIQNEEMEVDCKILTGSSEYFSAYFTSNLKEGVEQKYPISDCEKISDFAELLSVVNPYGKSIDNSNVAMLLQLSRQFLIPTVTHRCENFLIERMNRKEAKIENIELAEIFDLEFAKELVLACFGDTEKFRELTGDEHFNSLSDNLKYRVALRYIEIDMKNNSKKESYY